MSALPNDPLFPQLRSGYSIAMSGNHDDHHAHDHGHDHSHDHPHGHRHGHGHSHAPADFGRAFAIGTALNCAFVVIEVGAGFWSDSVALLADAGHNLSDVLGLLIAWGGATLAKQAPSGRFTYGLRGSSILAALANAVLLLVASGAIAWESLQRLFAPQPVHSLMVMAVAAAGIAVNGFTALLFARGRHGDLNIRGAFVHMAADAVISAGVVVAGGLILFTRQSWLDPAMSLVIVLVILWGSWGLLRDSTGMALQAVPPQVDAQAVRETLARLPGVTEVHDLHIWPMSTTETALTAHLVIPAGHPGNRFLTDLQERLHHDFAIDHATVQIEIGGDTEDPSHHPQHCLNDRCGMPEIAHQHG